MRDRVSGIAKSTPQQPDTPLRGHAAWLAEKQRISARNDAAFAAGRERRQAKVAEIHARDRDIARRMDRHLPEQPSR